MGGDLKTDVKYSGNGDDTQVTFISNKQKYSDDNQGCCHKKSTHYCCLVSLVLGCIILILGVITLIAGESLLTSKILKSMALTEGSDRLASWLKPPVQAHLEGYAFSVLNPDDVINGAKPKLKEVGPFIYKAVTVKDSVDFDTKNVNLKYEEDGEHLTYRQRKFYFLDEERSVGNPDETIITVPNIPYLTGMHKIKDMGAGAFKDAGKKILEKGLAKPFIDVSFSGLLWGYNDDLPCNSLARPDECPDKYAIDIFDEEEEEDEGWDWKRKKRSVGTRSKRSVNNDDVDLRNLDHDSITKAKAAYVDDCKCEWGLFRDRNVTLRQSIQINHGILDLAKKGWVDEYDGKTTLNWWKKNSQCDKVGGQDGGTLYPGTKKEDKLQMFIDLMCRKIDLEYEKNVEHAGLDSLRFIPPINALGAHDDQNMTRRNPDNECYCMKDQAFTCFKTGVLNMAPCKINPDLPKGAPIALSYPHFYQADESYLNAVEGLNPQKEKHEFYVDISPDFGFPLAIRPRFQLNVVIRRDEDVESMRNFADELVLPFLWAQDGFSEPSEEMAKAIKFGLDAPSKLSLLGGVALIAIGGGLVLGALTWMLVTKRNASNSLTFPSSR